MIRHLVIMFVKTMLCEIIHYIVQPSMYSLSIDYNNEENKQFRFNNNIYVDLIELFLTLISYVTSSRVTSTGFFYAVGWKSKSKKKTFR